MTSRTQLLPICIGGPPVESSRLKKPVPFVVMSSPSFGQAVGQMASPRERQDVCVRKCVASEHGEQRVRLGEARVLDAAAKIVLRHFRA